MATRRTAVGRSMILVASTLLAIACGGEQSSIEREEGELGSDAPQVDDQDVESGDGTTVPESTDLADDVTIEGLSDAAAADYAVNGFVGVESIDRSALSCDEWLSAGWETDSVGVPGPQLRFDREPITELRVGFVRATYPDISPEAQSAFPSVDELESLILGEDSRVTAFYDEASRGTFSLTGRFIADIVLEVNSENGGYSPQINELGQIDIPAPGFSEDDYDALSLVVISDYGVGESAMTSLYVPDGPDLTVNGERLNQLCLTWVTYALVGRQERSAEFPVTNDFEDLNWYVRTPGTEGDEFAVEAPLTLFERVFIHESIHALGIYTHAYSSTNGDRLHNEDEVSGNEDFLWRDYGNKFDIMGSSEYSHGLNAAYRHEFGWISEAQTATVDEAGQRTSITLSPLDADDGILMAEARLPYQYFQDDPLQAATNRRENVGYVFEVWPRESPLYWAESAGIVGDSSGLVIHKTDGSTSSVLDASPSQNFQFSWGNDYDLSDISLREGEVFDDGVIRVENVVQGEDGTVTFDVTIQE